MKSKKGMKCLLLRFKKLWSRAEIRNLTFGHVAGRLRLLGRDDGRHQVVAAELLVLVLRRGGGHGGRGGCRAELLPRPDEGHRPRHGRRRRVHGGAVVARHLGRPAGPRVGGRGAALAAPPRLLAHQGDEVGKGVLPVLLVLGGAARAGGGVTLRRGIVQMLRGQACGEKLCVLVCAERAVRGKNIRQIFMSLSLLSRANR